MFKKHNDHIHLLNRPIVIITHSYYSTFRGQKKATFQRILLKSHWLAKPLIIIWYFHNYIQMSSVSSRVFCFVILTLQNVKYLE